MLNIFAARLKTALTPSFFTAFALLSAFVLLLGFIFNREEGLKIRVGVLKPEKPAAARVLEGFRYYARRDCEIVVYENEEQMKLDVANRQLECAYAFTELMEAGHTEGAVTAYRSPMTLSEKVLDLMVAAVYMETFAGKLGVEVLRAYMDGADTMPADIQAGADEYLRAGALMEMIYIETGDIHAPEISRPAPYRRLFHGLTGLSGLLLALSCAMGLAGDAEKAVRQRLKSTGRGVGAYEWAGMMVILFTVALFLFLTTTMGEYLYPGLIPGLKTEIIMGFAYSLALSGIGIFLASFIKADAFPGIISFVFIFAALLGGTVFDIREVLAAIGFSRFLFPNYYYLDGIMKAGNGIINPQALTLCAAGLFAGALGLRRQGRDAFY